MKCIHVAHKDSGNPHFTVQNKYFSYSCAVFDTKHLVHLYFGAPLQTTLAVEEILRPQVLSYTPVTPAYSKLDGFKQAQGGYALATLPFEYPSWGCGDNRETALECAFSDGSGAYSLLFDSYQIHDEILQPQGMHLVHTESGAPPWSTLSICLVDPYRNLQIILYYCVHPDCPCLFRWTRITNLASTDTQIKNPSSASLDLNGLHKDLIYLYGAINRERHVQRSPLYAGLHQIAASQGASSHKTSPFIALADRHTDEHVGEALAFCLGYSGNFRAACSLDEHECCRMSIGIHKFQTTLASQASLDTPMAVLAHSNHGMNGISNRYHETIRNFISPPRWRNTERKIIINSWEAMYFDISEEKIITLAHHGKKIGAELLVLDDGWFSNRRDDTSSLGDWWVNEKLFPNGIAKLAEQVRAIGLDFGLWVEPEVISRKSLLFKEHPDWAIQIHGRPMTETRNQYILDLSNPAVQDYILDRMTAIFTEVQPNYVKWDMNRNMTEPASPVRKASEQASFMHAYMLGFYRVFSEITEAFPKILFESCSGGGGRFDLGLAHYSPRFWTSDQTDAVERLPIHYGSSLFFPPELMGSHVSAVPNHQVGRITPAESRSLTAMAYSYGYELNPQTISPEELSIFKDCSALYKRIRSALHTGRFYRLLGPLQTHTRHAEDSIRELSPEYAWMVSSEGGKKLYLFYACPFKPGDMISRQQLAIAPIDDTVWSSYTDCRTNKEYNATLLKHHGLNIPNIEHDYQVFFWEFKGKRL